MSEHTIKNKENLESFTNTSIYSNNNNKIISHIDTGNDAQKTFYKISHKNSEINSDVSMIKANKRIKMLFNHYVYFD